MHMTVNRDASVGVSVAVAVTVAANGVCGHASGNPPPGMTLEDGREKMGPPEYQNSNSIIWGSTTLHFGRRPNPTDTTSSCKLQPIPPTDGRRPIRQIHPSVGRSPYGSHLKFGGRRQESIVSSTSNNVRIASLSIPTTERVVTSRFGRI
jgi:hypothetical protein